MALRLVRTTLGVTIGVLVAVGAGGCSAGHSPLPNAVPSLMGVRGLARIAAIGRQPPTEMMIGFLMTDGSVMTQNNYGSDWYRYAPDSKGDYAKGTWTQLASLPKGYGPSAYASQVIADGRLVVSGGEYNDPGNNYPLQLTNLGAVYDPLTNKWTRLGHPAGWPWIGDSPSTMLPDGRMLMGQKLTKRDAYLDPKTLQWTAIGDKGKSDFNSEEGWTLLPDGTVLTADVKNSPNSEIYNPSTGVWKSAGSTIVDLRSPGEPGCVRYGPKTKDCYYPPGEIGPALLRPDGTVFATGAGPEASGYGTGHTAIYHTTGTSAGTWTAGPDFPTGQNAGDSYGILEPSGNVLVLTTSSTLDEFNGSTFTQVGTAAGPPVLLPTGQVLMLGANQTVIYTPTGKAQAAWAPTIKTAPSSVVAGKTYKITGTQFNGLSQAVAFGDEEQNATAYPLVRITNDSTHHVFYARTHDHSTMGVATGTKLVWTYFDVPKKIDAGTSTLEVVANGIASKPVKVSVSGSR